MQLSRVQTRWLAHSLALWTLLNFLVYQTWTTRLDDGHWIAVFNDARIYPIPIFAWLLVFVPSFVYAVGGFLVIFQTDKNRFSALEGICANSIGSIFCLQIILGWCVNGW